MDIKKRGSRLFFIAAGLPAPRFDRLIEKEAALPLQSLNATGQRHSESSRTPTSHFSLAVNTAAAVAFIYLIDVAATATAATAAVVDRLSGRVPFYTSGLNPDAVSRRGKASNTCRWLRMNDKTSTDSIGLDKK